MRYAIWIFAASMSGGLLAQSSVSALRFDAASVKPTAEATPASRYAVTPDSVMLSNVSVRQIIGFAYEIRPSAQSWKLVGGAEPVLSARFTVNAKASKPATPADLRAMLRALLAERFGLRLRTAPREMPIFALTRVRTNGLGRGLQPSKPADCVSREMSIEHIALAALEPNSFCSANMWEPSGAVVKDETGPIDALIKSIQDVVVSRPIVDATGLDGTYRWRLRYQLIVPAEPDAQSAPFILDALPEQLGLKLERRNGRVEVFVIDRVEMPTPD